MRLICQGWNQNDMKYVIRLKSPVHVWSIHWKDVNATLKVTDGPRFISSLQTACRNGVGACNDVVWVLYSFDCFPMLLVQVSLHLCQQELRVIYPLRTNIILGTFVHPLEPEKCRFLI